MKQPGKNPAHYMKQINRNVNQILEQSIDYSNIL